MTCIYCGGKTTVTETANGPDEVIRRRKCYECEKSFYTSEADVDSKIGGKLMYEYRKRAKKRGCSR